MRVRDCERRLGRLGTLRDLPRLTYAVDPRQRGSEARLRLSTGSLAPLRLSTGSLGALPLVCLCRLSASRLVEVEHRLPPGASASLLAG